MTDTRIVRMPSIVVALKITDEYLCLSYMEA
jgi:hypothetical protein